MSKPLTHRVTRAGVAGLLALGLSLGASSCGFNVGTLQPYDAGEGVNTNAGGYEGVDVRNLMILVDQGGKAFLSATLVAKNGDDLTAVYGQAISPQGTSAGSFTVAIPGNKLAVPAQEALVLTDGPALTVSGVTLRPGLTANISMTFAKAGNVSIVAPIVDGTKADYRSISPSPAPSASPSA